MFAKLLSLLALLWIASTGSAHSVHNFAVLSTAAERPTESAKLAFTAFPQPLDISRGGGLALQFGQSNRDKAINIGLIVGSLIVFPTVAAPVARVGAAVVLGAALLNLVRGRGMVIIG
jgi:hypothetical protein